MTDLEHFQAERVRRALIQRDGRLDFDEYLTELTNLYRDHHGVEVVRRLEILC